MARNSTSFSAFRASKSSGPRSPKRPRLIAAVYHVKIRTGALWGGGGGGGGGGGAAYQSQKQTEALGAGQELEMRGPALRSARWVSSPSCGVFWNYPLKYTSDFYQI